MDRSGERVDAIVAVSRRSTVNSWVLPVRMRGWAPGTEAIPVLEAGEYLARQTMGGVVVSGLG